MENYYHYSSSLNSSPRARAMALALATAVLLSPLYIDRGRSGRSLKARWSSGGLVLPAVVAVLVVAIKACTVSSSSKKYNYPSPGNNRSIASGSRIGSSSWGLAGILVMLVFVISWQNYVQHLFWR